MAKNSDVGLKQLPNGNWSYRIYLTLDGRKVDTTCRVDDNGLPFKTKKAAREARDAKIVEMRKNPAPDPNRTIKRVRLSQIYEDYMANGTTGKAPTTIRKQQSMWENHVEHEFGNRYIDDITLKDLQNYLSKMYHNGDGRGKEQSYSYKYVEGFLKFFYLLWACAYADNYLPYDVYDKMFVNKKTRLSMPKMTQEDKEDEDNIKSFTPLEIEKMNLVLNGTNFHISFILGYMLGVRISECFGLMWDDINWNEGTVKIRRQMLYEDGCFVLRPVKTLESDRDVHMNDALQDYLFNFKKQQDANRAKLGHGYRATEKVLDRTIEGVENVIIGGDFINRKENGELMTSNSAKYWAKILKEIGIDFKYHSLRKSYGTFHAAANTPLLELKSAMGHKKIDTTMKYYINTGQLTRDKLVANLSVFTNMFADGSITISEARRKELIDGGALTKKEFVMPNVPIPSEKTVLSMFPNMEAEVADIMERIKNLKDTPQEEMEAIYEESFSDFDE